jgi:hypothetical protein
MATIVKARQIESGTNGDVLTVVAGEPTWQAPLNYIVGVNDSAGGFVIGIGSAEFTGLTVLRSSSFILAEAQTGFVAATFTRLKVNVINSTTDAASNFTLQVNGVDSALSVTIPAGTDGVYEVVANVTIANNDLISFFGDGGLVAAGQLEVVSAVLEYSV